MANASKGNMLLLYDIVPVQKVVYDFGESCGTRYDHDTVKEPE